MKITTELLQKHNACLEQVELFGQLYPDGLWPNIETLTEAAAAGLDVWWACRLLHVRGPGSLVAYALWCAQQVAHLTQETETATCLRLVEAEVLTPGTHSPNALRAAANAAARPAAYAADVAAYAAAYAADVAANAAVAALQAANAAAYAAAYAAVAALQAAVDVDADAAYAAANAAERQAQLACLAQLLEEAA